MASFCLLWASHYLLFSLVYEKTVLSGLSHAHYNFPDTLKWVGIFHYQSTIYAEITFIFAGTWWLDIKRKDLNQLSGAQETESESSYVIPQDVCQGTGQKTEVSPRKGTAEEPKVTKTSCH